MEDRPGRLVRKREFFVEKHKQLVVSFAVPLLLAPKRPRGNVSHGIVLPRYVHRGERGRLSRLEPQCEGPEELSRHEGPPGRHAVHPRDGGRVVAEQTHVTPRAKATDLLHAKKQKKESGHLQV